MTRIFKTCAAICLAAALLLGMGMTVPALAAPVLTNGDFEDNPPPQPRNNVGWFPTGWTIPSGNFNVIKVDGPGPIVYDPNYPALGQDASNPGLVDQDYLDVSGGDGTFYQTFTPLCSGEVTYGAAVSLADETGAGVGAAGITILLDSDGSIATPRQPILQPVAILPATLGHILAFSRL